MQEYEDYDVQVGYGKDYAQLEDQQLSIKYYGKGHDVHYVMRINTILVNRLILEDKINFAFGREKRSQIIVLTFTKKKTGIQINKNNCINNKDAVMCIADKFLLFADHKHILRYSVGLITDEETNIYITEVEH